MLVNVALSITRVVFDSSIVVVLSKIDELTCVIFSAGGDLTRLAFLRSL